MLLRKNLSQCIKYDNIFIHPSRKVDKVTHGELRPIKIIHLSSTIYINSVYK